MMRATFNLMLAFAGALVLGAWLTTAEAGDRQARCQTFNNPDAHELGDFLNQNALRRNTRVLSGSGGAYERGNSRRRGSESVMWMCAW